MTPRSRTKKVVRRALTAVVVCACAVGLVAIGMWRPWEPALAEEQVDPLANAVTVPVELGTLTSEVRLNAALDYGAPIALPAAPGVLTALPAAGQVIEVGGQVYEANGRPVILIEGARPMWRELAVGIERGHDVKQLEEHLARIGLLKGDPDMHFDWRTREAVRRWQKDLGLPQTGSVAPSDVVVIDAPNIRMWQVTSTLGDSSASPGTYTAATLRAVATLSPAQAQELTAGTPVTVVLAGGHEIATTIAEVDPGGIPEGDEGKLTSPTARIDFPDQEEVKVAGPGAVRVIIHSQEQAEQTLVVPTTALIATAENMYAVEVLEDGQIVRVPVEIGMAADARVQILASGTEVEGAPDYAQSLEVGDDVVLSR